MAVKMKCSEELCDVRDIDGVYFSRNVSLMSFSNDTTSLKAETSEVSSVQSAGVMPLVEGNAFVTNIQENIELRHFLSYYLWKDHGESQQLTKHSFICLKVQVLFELSIYSPQG